MPSDDAPLAGAGPRGLQGAATCPSHLSIQTNVAEGLLCAGHGGSVDQLPGLRELGAGEHTAQECSDQRAVVVKNRDGPNLDTVVLRETKV